MKGYKLRLLFEIAIAFVIGVFLTFWGNGMSWSENAVDVMDEMHPLLNGLLLSASWAFRSFAENFIEGNDVQFKINKKLSIKTKHLLFGISYGFGGILVFPMDSAITSDVWHYVATGLTVFFLVLFVSAFFKMYSKFWYIFTLSILGAGLWLAASFIWGVSLVRYPEFALMVVGLILLIFILFKKIKQHGNT